MPAARLTRSLTRGSLAGAGVLVAVGALTPALHADPGRQQHADRTPELAPESDAVRAEPLLPRPALQPAAAVGEPVGGYFGTGKDFGSGADFTIGVSAASGADVPAGLAVSGARFDFTDSTTGELAGSCTTTDDGSCTVVTGSAPDGDGTTPLPAGTYHVTQATAPLGLAPVTGTLGTVQLVAGGHGSATPAVAQDGSLFEHALAVTVTEDGTAQPGLGYRLTGPSFAAAGDPASATWGPVTSGVDGVAEFGGGADDWFAPGASYGLAPVATPTGWAEDDAQLVVRAAEHDGPLTATHRLVPASAGPVVASSSTATAAPAAPSPAAAPAPVAAPVAGSAPVHRRRPAATPVATPSASPSPSPTSTPVPAVPSSAAPAAVAPAAVAAPAEVRVAPVSRTQPLTPLFALGAGFVALVFLLLMVVRRRARREH